MKKHKQISPVTTGVVLRDSFGFEITFNSGPASLYSYYEGIYDITNIGRGTLVPFRVRIHLVRFICTNS